MGRPLVIVESPAKARTIGKFLGDKYAVEASVGHIRDLPRNASEIPPSKKGEKWARLGVNVEDDFDPLYVVPKDKKAHIRKLKDLLADAPELYLATDEDREGESISWHLMEVLKPKVPTHRLVFHEITREAIEKAMGSPRSVDLDRVRAQETRRIVDRLFGYAVSPLLWKKIKPKLSAGRVQSVAVRLVVERERERASFVSAAWWDVSARLAAESGEFDAALVEWSGKRLASGRDFDETGSLKPGRDVLVLDQAGAAQVVAKLTDVDATVVSVEEKPYKERPAAPFTTSTLQQEANRKLRWTARRTMTVAQGLYENGWITYMRTDSMTLSDEAIAAARQVIQAHYGANYMPAKPRVYKSKAKGAQEAHEAIRPAGSRYRSLAEAKRELNRDEARLYELIWKRTVACQMNDAKGRRMSVRAQAADGVLEARGKTIDFAGFRRAYVEGSDNPEDELADKEHILPPVVQGEKLKVAGPDAKDHATQPPARLTEATLVKELEARGIGRPSTYASIIDTILHREYVFKRGSALVPTFTAFAVTGLLEEHLSWLVDYEFTAKMEERLDDIAVGERDPKVYLAEFYLGATGLQQQLVEAEGTIDPREVCTLRVGESEDGEQVSVRVGRFGPYLAQGDVRADLPEDLPPAELDLVMALALIQKRKDGPRVLGTDPTSGKEVYMMDGRFGPYVQLGGVGDDAPADVKKAPKPPRASLLKGMDADTVDLETGLALLSLPRTLGVDPKLGEPVIATNGRYGPYVKCGTTTRSIPANGSPLTITLAEASELLAQPSKKRRGPEPLREMGVDPKTERKVKLMSGRWGPYVTDGETNASLPKGDNPDDLTLEAAVELIRVREAAPKRPSRRKTISKTSTRKKSTAKKSTAKKSTAKKSTAKKTTAKKATAKKATAKKATAKKATTKKPAAKKATTKKAAAKKPAAKKTTTKKAAASE